MNATCAAVSVEWFDDDQMTIAVECEHHRAAVGSVMTAAMTIDANERESWVWKLTLGQITQHIAERRCVCALPLLRKYLPGLCD